MARFRSFNWRPSLSLTAELHQLLLNSSAQYNLHLIELENPVAAKLPMRTVLPFLASQKKTAQSRRYSSRVNNDFVRAMTQFIKLIEVLALGAGRPIDPKHPPFNCFDLTREFKAYQNNALPQKDPTLRKYAGLVAKDLGYNFKSQSGRPRLESAGRYVISRLLKKYLKSHLDRRVIA